MRIFSTPMTFRSGTTASFRGSPYDTDPLNPTLHLIDGHSLTFKAYYAVRHLTSPSGEPTGAVYGFLRMLLRFIDDYRPDHLAIVFDTGKPTFRKELYPQYKANREAPPPDFSRQMEWINQLLAAMRLPVYQLEGYEADDLIATMAERVKREGWQVVFLSADKDLFQLVDDRVTMLRPGTNDIQRFDAAAVHARLGIRPDQVIDWLTLVGDASDNVPGIPGIGEKTATRLLQEYGGLMQILERAHEIKRPKLREALLQYREQAMLARELVTVRRDVEFDWSPDACRVPDNPWTPEVVRLLVDLGFQSILKERQVETAPADLTPTGITSIEELDRNYEIISDAARLEAWAREALGAEWLALDTETTSTDAMLTDLVASRSVSVAPRNLHSRWARSVDVQREPVGARHGAAHPRAGPRRERTAAGGPPRQVRLEGAQARRV